ncbi:MAG: hypothetical protein PUE01_05560 [Clostridiaceae bacterium]|nr:hypothetical protein [Clostridiaceae bacterium]
MNGYELIMTIQNRMKDPIFAQKFNALAAELNNIPGLQQEVLRIAQISDDKKRKKAIDKLPVKAKEIVQQMFYLLNS